MQENSRAKTIRIECESGSTIDYRNLTELQGNLKTRNERDIERMARSILDYGFSFPFFVWQSGKRNYVMDGHGRLSALQALEEQGYEIPPLPVAWIQAKSKKQAKQKLLRMNTVYGEITLEGLQEFVADINVDWDEVILPSGTLEFEDDDGLDPEEQYSRKIEPPIYEPTSAEPPKLKAMLDTERRDQLLQDIDVARRNDMISVNEETLLREAANRHTVFNYAQIAEYYSHASPPMQRLMEQSALVIIDFKKAIELGFVRLTKQMAEQYAIQQEIEDGT